MANRLKEMGETNSWRLMVRAAIEGAIQAGYEPKRQPGRGLSNTWELTKGGETKVASLRTTRDRWVAFPPLDGGKRWKTLDGVELVLVSSVDDPKNPQNVEVYLFPADEVRKRFDDSYSARIARGHIVRDNYGMWVMLDRGDATIPSQVGSGLAADYPAIACYSIDELEAKASGGGDAGGSEADDEQQTEETSFTTVAEVLAWARSEVARLSGMQRDTIRLDLKIQA